MDNTSHNDAILIVDDSRIERKLLKNVFEEHYRLYEAADGFEALHILRTVPRIDLVLLDINVPKNGCFALLDEMSSDSRLAEIPVIAVMNSDDEASQLRALKSGAVDVISKPYSAELVYNRIRNLLLAISPRDRDSRADNVTLEERVMHQREFDGLTGLYNRAGFYRYARLCLDTHADTPYILLRVDIDRFKAFNDTFGTQAGDRLLTHIGRDFAAYQCDDRVFGHLEADHFVALIPAIIFDIDAFKRRLSGWLSDYPTDFHLSTSAGIYLIEGRDLEISLMCDRALMAIKTIKSSYTNKFAFYDDALRLKLLDEQKLTGEMDEALENGQFVVYFQPQINYDAGCLAGAEALVRWQHPTRGLLPPGEFIPLFEKNGFITKLDEYVWNKSCEFMQKWLSDPELAKLQSVSVNISRLDIYQPDLCEKLRDIVEKYGLSPSSLHLEITESVYMENSDQLIAVVKRLRALGFFVEMDDFGSGYSSLNMLKDVPVDLLKMDMRFLASSVGEAKSGNILSSVIRMTHWLEMPVISEGVETKNQADYLKSLGAVHMQGYYFGMPMSADKFEEYLKNMSIVKTDDYSDYNLSGMAAFWDPSAQSTLLFNSCVGGAALMEYYDGNLEIVRVNDEFIRQLRTTRDRLSSFRLHIFDALSPASAKLASEKLRDAVRTGKEQSLEVECFPGENEKAALWLMVRGKTLARTNDRFIFFVTIDNISEMKAQWARAGEIVANLPSGVAIYEVENGIYYPVYMSDRGWEILGLAKGEMDADILDKMQSSISQARIHLTPEEEEQLERGEVIVTPCMSVLRGDGAPLRLRVTCRSQKRPGGASLLYTVFDDFSAQDDRLAWQMERYRILSEAEGILTFDYDPGCDILNASMSVPGEGAREVRLEGYVSRLPEDKLISDDSKQGLLRTLRTASVKPVSGCYDFLADLFGTGFRWYRARYTGVPGQSGRVVRVVGRAEDITNLIYKQEKYRLVDQTDSLTGLKTKSSARALIELAISEKPPDKVDVLMFLDLDNFKDINDTNGHLSGDKVLETVGHELLEHTRRGDIVARFGGDEFLVYLKNAGSVENARTRALVICEALSAADFDFPEILHCSVGIVEIASSEDSFDSALQKADYALYVAKRSGKNKAVVYDPETMGTDIKDI